MLSVLVSLLILPGVWGALSLNQPEAVYNLGDFLSVTASVSSGSAQTDSLTLSLVCGTDTAILYKAPLSLNAGEQKTVSLSIPLTSAFVGTLRGTCTLQSTYGNDSVASSSFTMSNELLLTVPGALGIFAPDTVVTFNGTVVRKTGQPADGTVTYMNDALGLRGSVPLTEGVFMLSFTLPAHARSQAYLLSLAASEEDDLNVGASSTSFHIGQVLKSLEIALNTPLVSPQETLTYTALAYDQAHDAYYTLLPLQLIDSTGAVYHEETLTSGTTASFLLPMTAPPGVWTIHADVNGTEVTRQFSVSTLVNASVTLVNGTLTITNTGNVPYNKTMDITIGDVTASKVVSLDVGASQQFTLEAPDGDYPIVASDGATSFSGRSFLTGNAISVTNPADQKLISNVSLAWILLILLLGGVAAYYYHKIGKPEYGSTAPTSSYSTRPASGSFTFPEKKTQMIDRGERKPLPIVVVRVKNHPSVQGQIRSVIQQALGEASACGAIVQEQGASTWIAFFTQKEGEDAVVLRAVQAAESIQGAFEAYNVKGNPQIDYGIGIHFGELIVEEQPFKYTALGNTLSVAKKLAEYAPKSVLLSDDAHKFIASTTRCEKIQDRNAWRLKSISRRDRHNKFITGFMKRQGLR